MVHFPQGIGIDILKYTNTSLFIGNMQICVEKFVSMREKYLCRNKHVLYMFVSDTFYPIVCGNSEVETKFHVILLCISLENGAKVYINVVVFKFFSQTCKQENIRMRKT